LTDGDGIYSQPNQSKNSNAKRCSFGVRSAVRLRPQVHSLTQLPGRSQPVSCSRDAGWLVSRQTPVRKTLQILSLSTVLCCHSMLKPTILAAQPGQLLASTMYHLILSDGFHTHQRGQQLIKVETGLSAESSGAYLRLRRQDPGQRREPMRSRSLSST
jgi:hypothetical protein